MQSLQKIDGQAFVLSLNTAHTNTISQYHYSSRECPNFIFPERKFFHTADHIFTPQMLDHFFNRKFKIFSELTAQELPIFQNIYNFGEYAQILPSHKFTAENGKAPRHRRYPVKCAGLLYKGHCNFSHVNVEDVSATGLKIILDERLNLDQNYALRISIGIWKNTELIAKAVWRQGDIVGFEIQSADQNWAKLIQYLDEEFNQKQSAA